VKLAREVSMAETMRGAGRLTASLMTAKRRLRTASRSRQPGAPRALRNHGRRIRHGMPRTRDSRLESHDFFKIHLGPVLRSVHDAGGVGFAKRIGDEGVFADGDERAGPYDEENAARGRASSLT